MILRFDDVCLNADMTHINKMARKFKDHFPGALILYGISPLVCNMRGNYVTRQRIFPRIWNAFSDWRKFYNVQRAGIPENIPSFVTRASHGLIHVDHRLLPKAAQEMSILVSCSLAESTTFIPPFNKWNKDTEDICNEHDIHLIKFEDGWKCLEYEHFDPEHSKWYIHAREMTMTDFEEKIN